MMMKKYLLMSLIVISSTAIGHSQLPPCQGSDVKSWNMCQGGFTFDDGNKYVGEFKDGEINGHGTIIFAGGDKYHGEFKNRAITGRGTYSFKGGNQYVGEFINGQRNGRGTFTFASGDEYVGEWKDNFQSGQGTATFVNGNKYVGEYKGGKRNGYGTLTYADGRKYVGEWKDGLRDGQGTLAYADGRTETGTWRADTYVKTAEVAQVTSSATASPSAAPASSAPAQKSKLPPCRGTNKKTWNMCAGTETDSDGRKYVGEYAEGEPSGLGTLSHPDGTSFTAQWKNGQIDQLISCTGAPMCSQN
jgi:hypothetical protein